MSPEFDVRIITAIAFYVIGLSVLVAAFTIRFTHPVNRVFALGPFVTEEGLRLLLRNFPAMMALGMLALSAGAGRHAYWLHLRGSLSLNAAAFFGAVEMVFSVWAAICVLYVGWRTFKGGRG